MKETHRERVIAQIRHQETNPIPYTLPFEPEVEDALDHYYGSGEWRECIDNAIVQVPGPTAEMYVERTESNSTRDVYGSLWHWGDRFPHLVEPVIPSPSLEGFTFPSMETLFASGWKDRSLAEIERRKDYFQVAGFSFGLFERTWTLCGFDNVLLYLATEPDFYECLVENVANHQMQILEKLLELPVDGIMFSDDWGFQQGVLMGPKKWRRFFKPHLSRLYARTKDSGKYVLTHCCGGIRTILPDLIEIGLDVYESVQPEAINNNPYELKMEFGRDLTFWGALGSQSTIPYGTPDEIKAEIIHLCQEMGRGGGFILSPSKSLQPETPIENAAAVVEAFLQQSGIQFP